MSKIAVNEITDEQGSGRPSFTNGVQTSNINGGQVGGRRNLIINGAMQVAQRGTSFANATSTGYFFVDRWRWVSNCDEVVTLSQSSDVPDSFGYSAKVEVTTTDSTIGTTDYVQFRQNIEAQNLQQLGYGTSSAKTATLSFWVKSSLTGTYNINLWQNDASKYYAETYTINSANTWEYKTIVISGNITNAIANNNTTGIEVSFYLTAGSNLTSGTTGEWRTGVGASGHNVNFVGTSGATWQITGVQLEVGDTATEFEHRPYGEELALCQRYYQVIDLNGVVVNIYGGTTSAFAGTKITKMRSTPSINFDMSLNNSGNTYTNSTNAVECTYGLNANPTSDSISFKTVRTSGTWPSDIEAGHTYVRLNVDAEL